jgi:hypothetical protein
MDAFFAFLAGNAVLVEQSRVAKVRQFILPTATDGATGDGG